MIVSGDLRPFLKIDSAASVRGMTRWGAVAAVVAVGLVGCSSTTARQSTTAASSVGSATPAAAPVPPRTTTSTSPRQRPKAPPQPFPRGYPKVVAVTGLPDQVRYWYRLSHYTRAVAIAPGVWTPLAPGASVADAVASMVLDGFCGSVTAYERKYLHGASEAGTCW